MCKVHAGSWNYHNIFKVLKNPNNSAEMIRKKRNTKHAVKTKSTGQLEWLCEETNKEALMKITNITAGKRQTAMVWI